MPETSSRHQSGFGLIEVMVAILILSLAFLGLAALVIRALATNTTAMARSVATVAAYSIQDAMRSDRSNAVSGKYNVSKITPPNNCPAASGTLAQAQLNRWCTEDLAHKVLNGAATGTIACTATGLCTVTITWDDSRNGKVGGSATQTVTAVSML